MSHTPDGSAGGGRLLGRAVLSVADQAVVSGASFATSVIVARAWAPDEFGAYTLALGLVLFVRAVVGELVCSPYTIYCGRRDGPELAAYTGSALVHYLALTGLGAAGLAAVAGVLAAGSGPAGAAAAVGAVAGAAPFLLVREFARRVDLSHLYMGGVFATDSGVAVAQVGGLLLLRHFHLLTVVTAFAVLAGVCAAAVGVWATAGGRRVRVVPDRVAADWRHNWGFARWAAAGFLVGSTTPLLLPWVVAVWHGPAATGVLAASVTLINLAGMYITGVTNFLTPQAARAYAAGGVPELRRVLGTTALLFAVTLGGFVAAVAVLGDRPAALVFGPGYAGGGAVLVLLAAAMLANALGITAGNGLWALDRPRANVSADAAGLAATAALTVALVGPYGGTGAAAALLGGSVLGAAVRTATLVRLMRAEAVPS